MENFLGSKTVVLIPVYGKYDLLVRCISSVLKFTPDEVEINIYDDCFPGETVQRVLDDRKINDRRIKVFRQLKNLGFVENCNSFLKTNLDKNVIILNSDTIVSIGWFEAMISPLNELDNIATITAMTNDGGLATVELSGEKIPYLGEEELFTLNHRLYQDQILNFGFLPVGVGHCMLITSRALSLVGLFDSIFSPGYSEEVDFSMRATKIGFVNILAPTFVSHAGGQSFGDARYSLQSEHHQIIEKRYPDYTSLVQKHSSHNEECAAMFLSALIAYRGLKLLVDGRMLVEQTTGTSRLIYETVKELASRDIGKIALIVPTHLIRKFRSSFPESIEVYSINELNEISKNGPTFDVIYRPAQFNNYSEIIDSKIWSHRLVYCQLDFISFNNFHYFANSQDYYQYKKITTAAMTIADSVTYISNYVKEESRKYFLREEYRDGVIGCGVDHFKSDQKLNTSIIKEKKIIMYGAAFAHKNRSYAIDLFEQVYNIAHDISFHIIGPRPTFGENESEKNLELNLPKDKLKISEWISDGELIGEIQSASLVLYPSTIEGFGFVPFEAASLNTPTIFASSTSMKEMFPNIPFSLNYNVHSDAKTVVDLINDAQLSEKQLKYIDFIAKKYSWCLVVNKLLIRIEMVTKLKSYSPRWVSFEVLGYGSIQKTSLKKAIAIKYSATKVMLIVAPLESSRRRFLRRILRV